MCFTNQNAETVACILLFRKSRHKPILESTSKYGFYPDLGRGREIWRRSEHAHASYPGLSFRALYGVGRKESSGTGLINIPGARG